MRAIRLVGAVVVCLLVGCPQGLAAAEEPLPRFRLVSAESASGLERKLQSEAGAGYRLVAAAQGVGVTGRPRLAALLERADDDAVARGYRVLACAGSLRDEAPREALARLGAEGYHLTPRSVTTRKIEDFWLPESAYEEQMVLILERGDPGRRYAFDSLSFGDYELFYEALGQRRKDGFQVVGMWNTGRRLQLILQRRTDEGAALEDPAIDEHRLLLMATRLVLVRNLQAAARDGFRILAAADPSTTGPPVLLLEKSAAPGHAVEYGFLDDVPVKQMKDKLARKLNKRARGGWRVTRRGTTAEVITLQRPAVPSERADRAEYRLLSSRQAPGLPRSLEEAAAKGFEVVQLFVEPDETTVLVERISR